MDNARESFYRALGKRIREGREFAGMSQDQLARAVHLSRTSITNIEQGRQGVQVYILSRIIEALNRPVADFLPDLSANPPGPLPDKVLDLEPSKREWAERVMRTHVEGDKNAT